MLCLDGNSKDQIGEQTWTDCLKGNSARVLELTARCAYAHNDVETLVGNDESRFSDQVLRTDFENGLVAEPGVVWMVPAQVLSFDLSSGDNDELLAVIDLPSLTVKVGHD